MINTLQKNIDALEDVSFLLRQYEKCSWIDHDVSENKSIREYVEEELNKVRTEKYDLEELSRKLKGRSIPLMVGIVGGFSTGKSTFINSLLREEILGVDIKPATAQITELVYGSEKKIYKILSDESLEEISYDDYKRWSLHNNEEVLNEKINGFRVVYPSDILNNITIIDTPGFSSQSKDDDLITESWIEKLDVLIWLFDANKVGDSQEIDRIKKYSHKNIIAVINKIDLKSPSVRDKIKNDLMAAYADFKRVFFYSAAKITKTRAQHAVVEAQLDQLKAQIISQMLKKENIDVNVTSKWIQIKNGELIQEIPLERLKDNKFEIYEEELLDEFKMLSKQQNDILKAIHQNNLQCLVDNQKHVKQSICVKLENDIIGFLDSEMVRIEKLFESCDSFFCNKLDQLYEPFYKHLFEKLFNEVFEFVVDTGFFSDTTHFKVRKKYHDNAAEKLREFLSPIFNRFKYDVLRRYRDTLKRFELSDKTMDEVSDLLRNNKDNSSLVDSLVDSCIMNSVDGVCSLINLASFYANGEEIENKNNEKDYWKYRLDDVIPDETLRKMIYDIVFEDLLSIYVNRYGQLKEFYDYAKEELKVIQSI